MIKRLRNSNHPEEVDIAVYLSSPAMKSDSRNHCCPVLEVLHDPYDADFQYIVMPLLRNFQDPKFVTVGEAVEFFRQAFEVSCCFDECFCPYAEIVRPRASSSCMNIALLTGMLSTYVLSGRLPIKICTVISRHSMSSWIPNLFCRICSTLSARW